MERSFLFVFLGVMLAQIAFANQQLDSAYAKINSRDYESAILICKEIIESSDDEVTIAEAYFTLAFCYEDLKEPTEALASYYHALRFNEEEKFAAGIYNNLAIIYFNVSLYEESIQLFDMALLGEKRPDRIGRNLVNRCISYRWLKNYEQALADAYKALTISEQIIDSTKRAYLKFKAYNQIGLTKHEQGDYVDAITNFNKANALNIKQKTYVNLGLTYQKTGAIDTAVYYFEKSISHTNRTNSKFRAYQNLGDLLLQENRLTTAEESLNSAIFLFDEITPIYNSKDIAVFRSAGNLYRKVGKDEKAFELYNKTMDLQEGFNERQKAISNKFSQLALLKTKDNFNAEIESQQQEKNNTTRTILTITASLIVILLLFWRYKKLKKAKKEVENSKTELRTSLDNFLNQYGL